MFTGIIEEAGQVLRVQSQDEGARLELEAPAVAADVRLGDSVAVNGVCLTVVAHEGPRLAFDAVRETLQRSNLGTLRPGHRVNLERPLRAGGRLDGHLVQGHVDGTGVLSSVVEEGGSHRLRFQALPSLLRYVVEKGSIAVDGISLTVAAVGPDWFEVVIIPHTWQVTNLSGRGLGETVNLEVDILAKYVERLLAGRLPDAGAPGGA
ncbi:MAG: riboflavin synthase [Armatimonadota bacterium]